MCFGKAGGLSACRIILYTWRCRFGGMACLQYFRYAHTIHRLFLREKVNNYNKVRPNLHYVAFYANWINDFIVEVPELPGCMADGSTAAEAIENSEIIITEWIETAVELGREIPESKGRLMFA